MNNVAIIISRILLGLFGLLFIFIAFGFLFNTQISASNVGLEISTHTGYATVRADMAGYFIVGGALLLYASINKMAQFLWPVLLLVVAAFVGRLITVFANGYDNSSFIPMIVELIIISLIIYAQRHWPIYK